MSELTAREVATRPLRAVLTSPRSAGLVVVAVVVQLVTVLPIPFLIQRIFDRAIPAGNTNELIVTGLAVIALFLLGAVAAVLLHRRLTVLAESIGQQLRNRLATRLHELPIGELRRRGKDDLFDLMLHETNRVSNAISMILSQLAPAVLLVAGLVVVLAATDWLLFLVAAAFAPLMFALNWVLVDRIHNRQVDLNESRRSYSSGLLRTLRLMPLTRITDGHGKELGRLEQLISTLEKRIVRHSITSAVYTSAQQSIVITAALSTLIVGGAGVISDRITLGTLFSFYAAIALLRPPLDRIISSRPALAAGRIAIARFDDLFEDAIDPPYTGTEHIDFDGRIELLDVAFGYRPDIPVVGPVSFAVEPGQLTVLTGPNGSGKSTLIDLICGLYRPGAGRLCADGRDYSEVDVAQLRRRMGVVFQDPFVVDGSIDQNLRFGGADIDSEEDLEQACALALFDETVASLPNGRATVLTESEHTLSGGQAQRVATARSLLTEPELLVVDDLSSALDVSTERDLWAGLQGTSTVIAVSHRQFVIDQADQVITLENGRIVDPVPPHT